MNMLLRSILSANTMGIPVLLLAVVLVGCAGTPATKDQVSQAAPVEDWPAFQDARTGETTYRVDSQASEVLIRVDPEGPMAQLGHSHVVGGPVLSGTIVSGSEIYDARLDLKIDAAALEVDRPEWRRALGLEAELDMDAIEGTRDNMRSERVLDVTRHPEIAIRSVAVAGPDWMPTVTVRIRLRGEVRELAVPVAVIVEGRRLQAIGRLELLQSDFGIEPFSAAGGALRVSDRVRIRFRIVARAATKSTG